jgi:D-alanine-D-alanine ligase
VSRGRKPRPQRVLLLCHADLVPPADARDYDPDDPPPWRTELDVREALTELGHEVRPCGIVEDVEVLRHACLDFEPQVVFNLLVEFQGRAELDQHVVSYLELLRRPTTGCGPRGLTLARDKALAKHILAAHGIDTPRFQAFPRGQETALRADLAFPLIVKSRTEEASLGIARDSVVKNAESLARRVAFVHESIGTDAIVEEFVDGRELYAGLVGGARPRVLPTWELVFGELPAHAPRVATREVKFSSAARRRLGITSRAADLPAALERRVARVARAVWSALDLAGCARIDLRLSEEGRLVVLEANPNPELARHEDLADAAEAGGIPYPGLVQRLLDLARGSRPR